MDNLIGKTFERWTVIRFHDIKNRNSRWWCRCECGTEKPVFAGALKRGISKSCGCLHKEIVIAQKTRHGMASNSKRPAIYTIWAGMKQRCNNKNADNYEHYGQRGIYVCKDWNDFINFKNWAFANGYQPGLEIDRVDNDGPYCPKNCRWVTKEINMRNKSNNRLLTINGKTQTLAGWAEESGLNMFTIRSRIRYGWPPERLLEPIKTQKLAVGESGMLAGKGKWFAEEILRGETP